MPTRKLCNIRFLVDPRHNRNPFHKSHPFRMPINPKPLTLNLEGKNNVYVLFPDHGAYDRYAEAVEQELFLDLDHILQVGCRMLLFSFRVKGVKAE